MKKLICLIAIVFLTTFITYGQDEVLTNQSIIELSQAGMEDKTLIRMIGESPTDFDLSARGVIILKRGGVSERVLEFMLQKRTKTKKVKDDNRFESSGFYIKNKTDDNYTKIDVASNIKSTKEIKPKVVLRSKEAKNICLVDQELFLYISPALVEKVSSRASYTAKSNFERTAAFIIKRSNGQKTLTPDDFRLVRMKKPLLGNKRKMKVGSKNKFKSVDYQIKDKDLIHTDYDEVEEGLYRININDAAFKRLFGLITLEKLKCGFVFKDQMGAQLERGELQIYDLEYINRSLK